MGKARCGRTKQVDYPTRDHEMMEEMHKLHREWRRESQTANGTRHGRGMIKEKDATQLTCFQRGRNGLSGYEIGSKEDKSVWWSWNVTGRGFTRMGRGLVGRPIGSRGDIVRIKLVENVCGSLARVACSRIGRTRGSSGSSIIAYGIGDSCGCGCRIQGAGGGGCGRLVVGRR
jgi:hypothetical protein